MKRFRLIKTDDRIVLQRWSVKLQMYVIETSYRAIQIDNFSDIRINDDDTISISWGVQDFEGQAVEKERELQEEKELAELPHLYDRTKFSEALHQMKHKHDANYGITWDTIDFYLNYMCRVEDNAVEVVDESTNYTEEDENEQ